MKKVIRLGWVALALGALLLGACVSQPANQPPTTVQANGTVAMQAANYSFTPSNIQLAAPGSVTLQIANVAKGHHNFTLKDPSGVILQDVDLPPGQTVTLTVNLASAGTYTFYCNHPFHATFGMKGQIKVGS